MVVAPSLIATSTTLAEEVEVGAAGVLGAPLHVVGEALRAGARCSRILSTRLLAGHPQLVLEVQVGGGEEDVDAARARRRRSASPARSMSRSVQRASAAMTGRRTCGRDLLHAPEVGLGGRREPGLDDVHPEHLELPGESHLLLDGEAVAGRLLAVPECRVEDDDSCASCRFSLGPENESAANPLVRGAPAGLCESCYRLILLATGTPRNPSRPIRRTGRTPRRTRSRPLRFMSSVAAIGSGPRGRRPAAACIKIPVRRTGRVPKRRAACQVGRFAPARTAAAGAVWRRRRHLTHASDSISMQPC